MTTMVQVQHAPPPSTSGDWAYHEDIPGSRCGPEDGPWPKSFKILEEDEIWRELRYLAKPHTYHFDTGRGWRADSVNFQPSPRTRTQDRYAVKELDVGGKKWGIMGVFDGHLGDVTVEHVSHHLPNIVHQFLQRAWQSSPERLTSDPQFISECFSRSIIAFDEAIAGDVLDLFGGIEGLANYSDVEIRRVINDQHRGGANYTKARLNMYGTTALVALVDPEHSNLWIANVGDCKAVLVSPNEQATKDGSEWKVDILTTDHNGDNDAEVERVRRQHPGEPECVVDRRVLGALAPFRALGDTPFKQPPEFTRRILFNLLPGFHDTSPWEEFLKRNRTPPYISSEPEITHFPLRSGRGDNDGLRFLVLHSDGFSDLCGDEEGALKQIFVDWAKGVVDEQEKNPMVWGGSMVPLPAVISPSSSSESSNSGSATSTLSTSSSTAATLTNLNINHLLPTYPLSPQGSGAESRNMALRLLRRALGEEKTKVSKVLTLDMESAWLDDTSIVVVTL